MSHEELRRADTGPRLATRVGRVLLDPCVLNASGPLCTYDAELWPLARSRVGAVVLKSTTPAPRAGNPEPRLWLDPRAGTSINSNGLCNLGADGAAEQIARLRAEFGKPVIGSVAALSPEAFPALARRVGAVADALEVNLSCPNVPGKPQLAFDLEASRRVLGEVRAATDCDLWVKLPPFQDRRLVEAMAELLARSGVQAAVAINSPSGLDVDVDAETTRIHPNDGMGGVGGRDILRIARWNVRQLWLALRDRGVAVIGVGGVASGADALSHVLCGASAVEVGTQYLFEGPGVFARLEAELRALLAARGVRDINAKIGALRVLPAEPARPPVPSPQRIMHEDALTTTHRPEAPSPPLPEPGAPFVERLRARVAAAGPVCFGLDPEPARLPIRDCAEFYLRILGRMHARGALPACVKPNLAYYERLGDAGMAALRRILEACRSLGVPVLLDGKRGDIDRSAGAYAEALFAGLGADAVTVSPYMGGDAIAPFSAYCARGRGVFVLCRTSNPSAAELQELRVGDEPLFLHVAGRIAGSWWTSGVGAVVGATSPAELERVAARFVESGRVVPLLVPGVGAQGGSPREVAARLRAAGYELGTLLVSASSSIAFAHEAAGTHDFADAATDALLRLREALA